MGRGEAIYLLTHYTCGDGTRQTAGTTRRTCSANTCRRRGERGMGWDGMCRGKLVTYLGVLDYFFELELEVVWALLLWNSGGVFVFT